MAERIIRVCDKCNKTLDPGVDFIGLRITSNEEKIDLCSGCWEEFFSLITRWISSTTSENTVKDEEEKEEPIPQPTEKNPCPYYEVNREKKVIYTPVNNVPISSTVEVSRCLGINHGEICYCGGDKNKCDLLDRE